MKKTMINFILGMAVLTSVKAFGQDIIQTNAGSLTIQPVQHATFVMTAADKTIYVDPTGGKSAFNGIKSPDLVLITDIHGDHMDQKTLDSVKGSNTIVVAPKAVADKLTGLDPSK